jgi:DNA-binding response OmpR family regulator
VDEDDFGRETLGQILEADGYRVVRAANAAEARAHLRDRPRPGLIVHDFLLPRPAGREFAREAQEAARAGIPIIVVSSGGPSAATQESEFAGVVAHFEKPIAVGELLAAIRHHLPR